MSLNIENIASSVLEQLKPAQGICKVSMAAFGLGGHLLGYESGGVC